MKKSVIALSLVSVFTAASTSAASLEVKDFDAKEVAKYVVENGNFSNRSTDDRGKFTIKNEEGKYQTYTYTKDGSGKYVVTDTKTGSKITADHEGKIAVDGKRVEEVKVIDNNSVINGEDQNWQPNNDIIAVDSEVNARIDEAKKEAYEAGSKAVDNIYREGSAIAAKSAANESRINKLEDSFKDMAARQDKFEDKLNKMDKKMDGVMAGTHAVTNARPMVAGGQTAFGVGTGFAGSAQAVAVGVAHNFKDSAWSVSATTNVSTGSGVKTQVSGGVGAHYVF